MVKFCFKKDSGYLCYKGTKVSDDDTFERVNVQ